MLRHHPPRSRPATIIRAVGALVTTVAMTAAALFTAAAPAQAVPWPVNDGFENPAASTRWSFWLTGSAQGKVLSASPRSGSLMAFLRPGGAWASVERTVTLDPSGGYRTCGASIYVGKRGVQSTIGLEVIDAATFNYISSTTAVAPSLAFGSYQQVNFANFPHTTASMVFRISIEDETGDLDLDDFSIWCSRPLS